MVNPRTGRVHTSFGQATAVTGRLASTEPNLQNIPVRTAEGRRIREAFIAPPGHVLVSADYSQIELRIMAHLSGTRRCCEAFAKGADIHRATAAEIFGVTIDDVTAEQRRYIKAVNFGLIYGMSAFGLAAQLGIERSAAQQFIDKYFARYPGVADYMQRTRELAHAQGFVETVFGRRLWLPDINAGGGPRRQAAERAAINAPMQGTAADLIKLAMIAVQQWLDAQQSRHQAVAAGARRTRARSARLPSSTRIKVELPKLDERRRATRRAAGRRRRQSARTGTRRTRTRPKTGCAGILRQVRAPLVGTPGTPLPTARSAGTTACKPMRPRSSSARASLGDRDSKGIVEPCSRPPTSVTLPCCER